MIIKEAKRPFPYQKKKKKSLFHVGLPTNIKPDRSLMNNNPK